MKRFLLVLTVLFVTSTALPAQDPLKLQVTVTCRATTDICQRLRNAFAAAYGYQATIPDPDKPGQTLPNPETRQAFMERLTANYIREVASTQEARIAAEAARDAKKGELDGALKPATVRP